MADYYDQYKEAVADRCKETGLLLSHMQHVWPYSQYLKELRKELGPEDGPNDALIVQALLHESRMDLDRARDDCLRALVSELSLDIDREVHHLADLIAIQRRSADALPKGSQRYTEGFMGVVLDRVESAMKHMTERAFEQGMHFVNQPFVHGLTLDSSSHIDWREDKQ